MSEPRELIDEFFDGELSPGAQEELRAWLKADPENLAQFVREIHAHKLLRDELAARAARREISDDTAAERAAIIASTPPQMVTRSQKWILYGAVAAVVLIVTGFQVIKRIQDSAPLLVFTAKIDSVSGQVYINDSMSAIRRAAHNGDGIRAKDALETEGGATVSVRYWDDTALQFASKASLGSLLFQYMPGQRRINNADSGKRITVENGELTANVAPQPAGAPMIVFTPLAEATVVGTKFRLNSSPDATRLDVEEGKVRIARVADGEAVDVLSKQFVVVKASGKLQVSTVQ